MFGFAVPLQIAVPPDALLAIVVSRFFLCFCFCVPGIIQVKKLDFVTEKAELEKGLFTVPKS